ncbi:MAG: IclR family transcriptional regulator [Micrococcaceae bacterium]
MSEKAGPTPPEANSHSDSVRSISRAFEILQHFDKDNPHRHVRDLARLTKIPRTTVLRILSTLEGYGFVQQIAESTYQVGPGALRWFQVVQDAWSVTEEALDVVRALRDETGESANIYVRQGTKRVSIGQAEGSRTVRSVVRMGVPLPLTAGSSGVILLEDAPVEVVSILLESGEVSRSEHEEKLNYYRSNGFALSHGERESGASSLSFPVRCENGAVVALSLSGPTSRFDEENVRNYLEVVRIHAQKLEDQGLGPVEALLQISE